MIRIIIGPILLCTLVCVAIAKFSGASGGSDKKSAHYQYRSSAHFQICEKNGNFVTISELLQNRNKSLHNIMGEAGHTKYIKI
jgi:hypothetical protein